MLRIWPDAALRAHWKLQTGLRICTTSDGNVMLYNVLSVLTFMPGVLLDPQAIGKSLSGADGSSSRIRNRGLTYCKFWGLEGDVDGGEAYHRRHCKNSHKPVQQGEGVLDGCQQLLSLQDKATDDKYYDDAERLHNAVILHLRQQRQENEKKVYSTQMV